MVAMCGYAYTQVLPTWKQRFERTNRPFWGVGHCFNQQSTMCSETACRAVNRQFQSHHTWTLEGHVRHAVVERCAFIVKERWEQTESYRLHEHEGWRMKVKARGGKVKTALASWRWSFRRIARLYSIVFAVHQHFYYQLTVGLCFVRFAYKILLDRDKLCLTQLRSTRTLYVNSSFIYSTNTWHTKLQQVKAVHTIPHSSCSTKMFCTCINPT